MIHGTRNYRLPKFYVKVIVITAVLFLLVVLQSLLKDSQPFSRNAVYQVSPAGMSLHHARVKLLAVMSLQRNGQHISETVFKDGVLGNLEPEEKPKKEGPGEYGIAVQLGPDEVKQGSDCVKEWGFNQCASEKISMHREIPDTRPLE